MGKMKENPRYNVVSVRLTDGEKKDMILCKGYTGTSSFVLNAIQEKIERDNNGNNP